MRSRAAGGNPLTTRPAERLVRGLQRRHCVPGRDNGRLLRLVDIAGLLFSGSHALGELLADLGNALQPLVTFSRPFFGNALSLAANAVGRGTLGDQVANSGESNLAG